MIHLILRCDNSLLTCLISMLRLMSLKIFQSLKPPLILKILKVLVLRLPLMLKHHLSKLPLTLNPLFFPCWTRTKTRMGTYLEATNHTPEQHPFWWASSTLFCQHHCYPQVELQLISGRSTLLLLWFFPVGSWIAMPSQRQEPAMHQDLCVPFHSKSYQCQNPMTTPYFWHLCWCQLSPQKCQFIAGKVVESWWATTTCYHKPVAFSQPNIIGNYTWGSGGWTPVLQNPFGWQSSQCGSITPPQWHSIQHAFPFPSSTDDWFMWFAWKGFLCSS